jgi:hypothetical protein
MRSERHAGHSLAERQKRCTHFVILILCYSFTWEVTRIGMFLPIPYSFETETSLLNVSLQRAVSCLQGFASGYTYNPVISSPIDIEPKSME